MLTPALARAGDVVYQFGNIITGTAPAGPAPWVDALFEDVTPGTVRLTISNVGLTGSETEDMVYFNLNPSLVPTSLSFTYVGSSGSFDLPAISGSANAYKADGDGYFDIMFAFSTDGQDHRFRAGQSVTYLISDIPTLTVADFGYLSFDGGGAGQFYTAAHIQQIGGQYSGWLGSSVGTLVSEPSSTVFCLLAGSLVLYLRGLQRRSKVAGS